MSRWIPCKRQVFITRLRDLGFDGPYSGARHEFMLYGQDRQTIPSNPEYSVPQLRKLIRQIESVIEREITADQWNEM